MNFLIDIQFKATESFRHIGFILFGLILFGLFSVVRSMIQDREEDEQIQAQLNAIGYELMAEM